MVISLVSDVGCCVVLVLCWWIIVEVVVFRVMDEIGRGVGVVDGMVGGDGSDS